MDEMLVTAMYLFGEKFTGLVVANVIFQATSYCCELLDQVKLEIFRSFFPFKLKINLHSLLKSVNLFNSDHNALRKEQFIKQLL